MELRKTDIPKLTFQLALPITIILFTICTKWWYALPIDAPDTTYLGFPFPYTGRAWHTSGAFQFFIIEFIADVLTYFLVVFFLVLSINHYIIKITLYKSFRIVLGILSIIGISLGILIATNKENLFYLKRPYDIKIMQTGYQFLWDKESLPMK